MNRLLLGVVMAIAMTEGAMAQDVPATQIAGNPVTSQPSTWPSNPGAVLIIGNQAWVNMQGPADAGGGTQSFAVLDTGNPRTSVQWTLNASADFSVGGNSFCAPYCNAGQLYTDGQGTVFVPAWDKGHGGQPGTLDIPGVHKLTAVFTPGFGISFANMPLAPTGPSSTATGAVNAVTYNATDGLLYATTQQNGSLLTIANAFAAENNDPAHPQTVRTVGTTVDGKASRAIGYWIQDNAIYVGTTEGLDVFENVSNCGSPKPNCNAVPVALGSVVVDGAVVQIKRGAGIVGMAVNGGYIYMSVRELGLLIRYNPVTGGTQAIKHGLIFADNPNALDFDDSGNLYYGQDTSRGALQDTGTVSRILAAAIAALPAN